MSYDYSDYQERPGDNLMTALKGLADRQERLERRKERLERLMEINNDRLRDVAEKDIPQLLDGIGGHLTLDDGRVITIKEKVRASIPKDSTEEAIGWLDDNGYSAIVKRQFVIEFGKGDDAWARKFENDLRKRKKPLNVQRKKTVHPQTLGAFVREKLGEGVDLPMKLLGVFRQRAAKVERPER